MECAYDSLMSDSPTSAGDDGSDYEAPARVKYAIQRRLRARCKPRVELRSRKRAHSVTSFQFEDDKHDQLEGEVLPEDLAVEPDHDFRSSGRRDRPGRTQIDHDVFEGLPIRQWKQVDAPVGPPPVIQPLTGKSSPWPELPMPRDWHMLPEVSQQLLRAARAGKLYKPPTPPNDEEEGKPEEETDGPVKEAPKGYMTRKWSQVPRHQEAPEREYLAKRRKGLSSAYATGGNQQAQSTPAQATRMTKVRKLDAEGNPVIYEVQALEGQPVEGEIVEDAVATEAAPVVATVAPGTVIEGIGVANAEGLVVAATDGVQPTPPRRKPPPPRRKKKGLGKGLRKVMVVEPGMEGVVSAHGGPDGGVATLADGTTSAEGDTLMADVQDGDEEGSGEEGEEGEEGDEEEEGSEEGELANTPIPDTGTPSQQPPLAPTSVPAPEVAPAPILPPLDAVPGPDSATLEAVPLEQRIVTHLEPPAPEELPPPPEAPIPSEPPIDLQPLEPMDTSTSPNVDSALQRDRSSSLDEPPTEMDSHNDEGPIIQDTTTIPALPPVEPITEEPEAEPKPDVFDTLEKHLVAQEPEKPEEPTSVEDTAVAQEPEAPKPSPLPVAPDEPAESEQTET